MGNEVMTMKRFIPLLVAGSYLALVVSWPLNSAMLLQLLMLTLASTVLIASIIWAARRVVSDFSLGKWTTELMSVLLLFSLAMLLQYVLRPEYLTLDGQMMVGNGFMTKSGTWLLIRDSALISLSILVFSGVSLLLREAGEEGAGERGADLKLGDT
jgi:hypothetical protein